MMRLLIYIAICLAWPVGGALTAAGAGATSADGEAACCCCPADSVCHCSCEAGDSTDPTPGMARDGACACQDQPATPATPPRVVPITVRSVTTAQAGAIGVAALLGPGVVPVPTWDARPPPDLPHIRTFILLT